MRSVVADSVGWIRSWAAQPTFPDVVGRAEKKAQQALVDHDIHAQNQTTPHPTLVGTVISMIHLSETPCQPATQSALWSADNNLRERLRLDASRRG